MKKIMILGLVLVLMLVPVCAAKVWISPMKMTAHGNVSILGPAEVEKDIVLRNDGNESVIVTLNASGIDVTFKEFKGNELELGAGEEKLIHPIITVKEGRYEGVIKMVAQKKSDIGEGTGAAVVSTMSISVTTIGERVSPPIYLVAIPIGIICVIVGYLIYRKRK